MKRLLICSVAFILLSGCATVFTSPTDTITFTSIPAGAVVEINGVRVGRTPVAVPVKRSLTPPHVQVKLDGYETKYIILQNSFNKIAVFDILFWPTFVVDALTGTIMKYDITSYDSYLDPENECNATLR